MREASLVSSPFDTLPTHNKYYTNYYNPTPISSGKVIAYKKGLQQTGAFVLLHNQNEKLLRRTGILDDYKFAFNNDQIVWSEYYNHIRWDQGGRMRLSSYDLNTGKYKRYKSRNNRFSPFAMGQEWGCVEVDHCNRSYLVLLDSTLSRETGRIPAEANELFIHPSYHEGKITTVVQSPRGLSLVSIDPVTHRRHTVCPAIYYELDHPVAGDSLLIYRASYNGNNAFYRWTAQGPVNVLNSKYGLQFPTLSADKKQLYFSFYTADGYKPGHIDLAGLQEQPTVYQQFRLADSMKQEEKWHSAFQYDSIYPSRKYNKFTHLVNIHSWGPVEADLNDMDVDFGAVVYSQNKLSTLSFTAGYILKSGYDHGAWMLNASYKGWWPVFDFDLYSGRYDYESFNEGFSCLPGKKKLFMHNIKPGVLPLRLRSGFLLPCLPANITGPYNLMSVTGLSDYTMKN